MGLNKSRGNLREGRRDREVRAMSARKIPKWIVIDANTSEAVCERCGQRERAPLPAPISSFVKWCESFGDKHKLCRLVEKEARR
ncbi:MAG: hypothetical protein ABIF82_05685 [Planctomycetota bacterium]